jgi:hypothetical protein
MRSKKQQRTRAYQAASSRGIDAIDLWALGGAADSLQNRSLSGIGSSDNEDPEFDITGDRRKIVLCIHRTKTERCETEDLQGD